MCPIENNTPICPLCSGRGAHFHTIKDRTYYNCDLCHAIFLPDTHKPSPSEEKARYLEHNNDVYNRGYQEFSAPVYKSVMRDYTPEHTGLDYGSGTGPVISKILTDNGYHVTQYDPFFANYPERLNAQYDYIICSEVIEHFHSPHDEFARLYSLMNENATLYCMTYLYNEGIDFKRWNYKDDKTHVFIYREKTIRWIKDAFRFRSVSINGRLIVFQK